MVKSTAFGFDEYGEVDVLKEKVIEVQLSQQNNVLVKTEHISVNPVEVTIRKGDFSNGKPPKNFRVLGNEIQGEIVELTNEEDNLSVGDKVMAILPSRGDSEYVATNSSRLFKVPSKMPLEVAAAFPMIATTAYWALDSHFYTFKKGDTLAIIGASGNVGSLILQLAREKEIRIIAAGSQKNGDYLKELGADVALDYRNQKQVAQYKNSADYVINASLFNQGEELALSLIKDNGTYLGLNSVPDLPDSSTIVASFMEKTEEMDDRKAMAYLTNFYETHGLALKIGYKLPFTLEGLKEAHQLFKKEKSSGKIILKR